MHRDTVDDGGRTHRTRPSKSTSVENTEKDKTDPPIHTGYFHTGEANTSIFIVDRGNSVNYLVTRSEVP